MNALPLICQGFGLSRSQKHLYVFWQQHQGKRLLFVVYVDDIIITEDDAQEFANLKYCLHNYFQTKDLEYL